MKLEKTREALVEYESCGVSVASKAHVCLAEEARDEVGQAEDLLCEAAALKVFAVAGLSAFHLRLCNGGRLGTPNAADCQDPKCRAWAAAVKGADGLEMVRNAALEEAATYVWTHEPDGRLAAGIRALRRGG